MDIHRPSTLLAALVYDVDAQNNLWNQGTFTS
jgi:hypothetical protein